MGDKRYTIAPEQKARYAAAKREKYASSPARRAQVAAYNRSERGKATYKKWLATDNGKAHLKRLSKSIQARTSELNAVTMPEADCRYARYTKTQVEGLAATCTETDLMELANRWGRTYKGLLMRRGKARRELKFKRDFEGVR